MQNQTGELVAGGFRSVVNYQPQRCNLAWCEVITDKITVPIRTGAVENRFKILPIRGNFDTERIACGIQPLPLESQRNPIQILRLFECSGYRNLTGRQEHHAPAGIEESQPGIGSTVSRLQTKQRCRSFPTVEEETAGGGIYRVVQIQQAGGGSRIQQPGSIPLQDRRRQFHGPVPETKFLVFFGQSQGHTVDAALQFSCLILEFNPACPEQSGEGDVFETGRRLRKQDVIQIQLFFRSRRRYLRSGTA